MKDTGLNCGESTPSIVYSSSSSVGTFCKTVSRNTEN